MYKSLLCFLFFIGLFVLISCNKEKLKSPQASFLVANATQLTTNSSQGSNSHKITDLWLYVNDQFQGAYPVGSVMPIVAKDNADILLYPGIKNNGISATRIPYPFYKSIKLNQSITAGNTYTITPDFTYVSGLHFLANDSFDFSGGSNFTSVGDSAYTLTSDPYRTYGGSGKSVFMSMSDTKSSAEIRTSTPQDLPAGGATIYLEMDYKCNQTISVGVIGGGSDVREAIVVNPSSSWNKIYISLAQQVSTPPYYYLSSGLGGYIIYIKATKQVSTPEIYLDNIKLITQ